MVRLLPALLLLATPALAQAEGRRVTVVPFASLSGDLPVRVGAKAAGMLATELKNAEGVELVVPTRPTGNEAAQEALTQARTLVADARDKRTGRQFGAAEGLLTQALSAYEKAAPLVEDVGEVADAWALLAAVQYVTGKDEAGQASLTQALSLSPGRALPLAESSPRFARVVETTRQGLLAAAKGRLTVESIPAGLPVTVDGTAYGTTPLNLKDVPAGKHLWRVRLPSGEFAGGQVEVAAGKVARVSGQTQGADPESRIVAALTHNKVDAAVVAAAKEAAAAQQAEAVFFGALSRDGKSLALDAFVFQSKSGELRRLPRTTFDEDLLEAGQKFLALASDFAKGSVGQPEKPGVSVAGGRLAAPRATEAAFVLASGTKPAGPASPLVEEKKQPEGPRQPIKRAPLKRK